VAAEEKWILRFDPSYDDEPQKEFSLKTLVKLAQRGLFDADDDARVQRPGTSEWIPPKEIPEVAAALEARIATAQWRRGHAKGMWTIWRRNGEERLTMDQLIDCVHNTRTVTAETFLSASARPDEFRAAADWPIFWTIFGTAPWVVRLPDGSEYVANGNDELRQWARAGRVLPTNDVYDMNKDVWVKAATVL
jgi:hypothetical protein